MEAFHFFSKLDQTILLGKKASNLTELLDGLRTVPGSSIYYHTHRFLQQHNYLSPEPPNDFAYWVTGVLNDTVLGERLSSIDIIQFQTIAQLRSNLIELIEAYLHSSTRRVDCPPGEEFHYMASQIFVFPTPYHADNLQQFRDILTHISVNSIYYHVFDAKLRVEKGENDFSRWFADLGNAELAEKVRSLDPYTQTLESLRKKIIYLVGKYANN